MIIVKMILVIIMIVAIIIIREEEKREIVRICQLQFQNLNVFNTKNLKYLPAKL